MKAECYVVLRPRRNPGTGRVTGFQIVRMTQGPPGQMLGTEVAMKLEIEADVSVFESISATVQVERDKIVLPKGRMLP